MSLALAPALTDLQPSRSTITADVLAGLSQHPKRLPSKYFYDARGSRLFEQITHTPEYYPTRTELALLSRVLPDIARSVGPHLHVVELGSGSGRKTALPARSRPLRRTIPPPCASASACCSR